jgi:hypothetical protein
MHKFAALALILATVVAFPTTAEAKKRPTISTGEQCFYDTGTLIDIGEGPIVSCCYDDGCWICNRDYTDCAWDGKYRTLHLRKTFTRDSAGMDAGAEGGSSKPPTQSLDTSKFERGGALEFDR